MAEKFSAYLSIYNDWDILSKALRSIASQVDELVVVDGAYDWMVPHLTMLGLDPARSDPRVYAAIEASGIPFKVVSGTWNNEIGKRLAGYEACSHRYIFRVDADEIMFFYPGELDRFLAADGAVAGMDMPTYIAPGWISCTKGGSGIDRQSFLFDSRKISPAIHLNYLWLTLTADTLPEAGKSPFPVYSEPLAFNAHLTGWRTPTTSINRASFYVLNWVRKYGAPWIPELANHPLSDMKTLFEIIPPKAFLAALRRGGIAVGLTEDSDRRVFQPSTLGAAKEATFTDLYERFLGSLAAMNADAVAAEQDFLTCFPCHMDLSTDAARNAIAPNGAVTVRMSAPVAAGKARLHTYSTVEPNIEVHDLSSTWSGTDLRIELPETLDGERGMLRQCLEFQVWLHSPELSQRFQVLV